MLCGQNTNHADFSQSVKIRSVGSQQRLSRAPSGSPPSESHREHLSPAAQQTASMSKWLLGLAVLAVVAVLHIFSSLTAQNAGEDTPGAVYSGHDTATSGSSQATAKPTWSSLGRLGHELLTQSEHAYVSDCSFQGVLLWCSVSLSHCSPVHRSASSACS